MGKNDQAHPQCIEVLLADDDNDDCFLFSDALAELSFTTLLTTISDGEKLIKLLNKSTHLPHVLFLDLNMPRKNGFTCLKEIKNNPNLQVLPVIIISTSYDKSMAESLYQHGAHYYIRKPNDFAMLKHVLHMALTIISQPPVVRPSKKTFLLGSLNTLAVK